MSLKLRRGTNTQRLSITPAEGELIYTTDTKKLYIGDGTTAGGTAVNFSNPFPDILELTNTAESTGTTAGALIVTGGVGIGKDVNTGGRLRVFGSVDLVYGGASGNVLNIGTGTTTLKYSNEDGSGNPLAILRSNSSDFKLTAGALSNTKGITLKSTGETLIDSTTASTSKTTGSLILAGGLGVAGNIYSTASYDDKGEVRLLPINTQTTSYTLVAADHGKCVSTTSGITVPASIFLAGQIISIFNNSASAITLTTSAVTAYKAGTDTAATSLSLAARGIATVLFITATVVVISGNVT